MNWTVERFDTTLAHRALCGHSTGASAHFSSAFSISRTSGSTREPKYSISSWKCRKPPRIRSTPRLRYAAMRSAICSGVPISCVRNPSLYCTKSSKLRIGPHSAFVRRRVASLLYGSSEPFHSRTVGLGDDFAQRFLRLGLGIAGDDEAVQAEFHLAGGVTRVVAHVDELLGHPVEVLAVGEVPVGVAAAVAPRRRRVAALEDLGVRAVRGC